MEARAGIIARARQSKSAGSTGDEARAVLRLSDGTRDRAAILAGLSRDERSEAQRAGDCEEALDWLASNALLLE